MPFCPDCGYEYKESVETCPDCNRELKPSKPLEPEGKAEIRFKPLPNLPGRIYAEMLKGALEAQEIPCYIQGKGITDALQIGGTMPMDGVQLYVPENRYDEAVEIQRGMMDHI